MLTDPQMQILATALRAETNQVVVDALAIRDDISLTNWVNTASTTSAWNPTMAKRDLFEATNVTKFDGLTQGKRDAWKLLLDNSPIDISRQKMRNAVVDTWGNTDSVAVLTACTRFATNGELYLGSSDATTNTVTAKKLNVPGLINLNDVSQSLNRFQ
jgi:hypothetical protein